MTDSCRQASLFCLIFWGRYCGCTEAGESRRRCRQGRCNRPQSMRPASKAAWGLPTYLGWIAVGTRLTTNNKEAASPNRTTLFFFFFAPHSKYTKYVQKEILQVTLLDSTMLSECVTAVVLVCRLVVNFWASGAPGSITFF